MPGISIITNFDVNANAPIDSRMVVSNSTARNAIQYIYEGLKVYQLSDKKTYLWDGATWSLDTGFNGIYGGSGSLVGNTNVNFGQIGNTAGNSSYIFRYDSQNPTGVSRSSMLSYFLRHSNAGGSQQWQGVEFRHQLRVSDNTGTGEGPWISFNPTDPGNRRGGMAFATGLINVGGSSTITERLRINTQGYIGIRTDDPKSLLQIGEDTNLPITFDITNPLKTQISSNWYNNGGSDDVFDITKGSSKLVFDSDGTFMVTLRSPNALKTAFTQSIYASLNSVRTINDISANAWDAASSVNYQMVTMPEYVNNSEHRYTKIQSENWYQLSSSAYDNTNKWLLITDDANNFELTVTASTNRYITDIKILRNGQPRDIVPGTRVHIKFKHSNIPSNGNEFYIRLAASAGDTSSNIACVYNDNVVGGSSSVLKITHNPSTSPTNLNWLGDSVTFLKGSNPSGPKWDIINVERQSSIINPSIIDSTNPGSWATPSTTSYRVDQLRVKSKKVGTTYFCNLFMEFTVFSSTLTSLGVFYPIPANPLYGTYPMIRLIQPCIGHGSGIGNFPYPAYIDLTSVNLIGSTGFGFEIRRLDPGRTQSGGGLNYGYGYFATGSNNIYSTFVLHED